MKSQLRVYAEFQCAQTVNQNASAENATYRRRNIPDDLTSRVNTVQYKQPRKTRHSFNIFFFSSSFVQMTRQPVASFSLTFFLGTWYIFISADVPPFHGVLALCALKHATLLILVPISQSCIRCTLNGL